MPVTEYFITREKIARPLNETERFSEENSAKCIFIKKTVKTRNSIAIITDDREDSIINNVLRLRSNTRRPLRKIKLTQDENLFKKDSTLEQILNRLQKIEEKQGALAPNYS
ncbi:4464_t:CDS:2 [Gigaspora margarita]|uniref:4464_t:CDS:1 n=1 Tax=Gigaspora margarita TaxID=4874 RepID=A0ABN7VV79_GIGMA|nr:4464_t:CDS:2 [Gigaspora margarita]